MHFTDRGKSEIHLHQMYWLVMCAADRYRPHDCDLTWRYRTTLCSMSKRLGNNAALTGAQSAYGWANCRWQNRTSPCCQGPKEKHNAATTQRNQSRCKHCCLTLLIETVHSQVRIIWSKMTTTQQHLTLQLVHWDVFCWRTAGKWPLQLPWR